MVQQRTLIGILLASVLIGVIHASSAAGPLPSRSLQEGTNLLTNPGFEGLSCPGLPPSDTCKNYTHNVHIQDGKLRDNIETPEGWVTWWRVGVDLYQPEIVLMPASNPNYTGEVPRIRSGFRAVKFFTYSRNHDGGFYQVVAGLQPGATVQLSAYAHAWACNSMDGDNGWATSCGDPWTMMFQVGIEPNGVADPFASSIVWSPEQIAPDVFQSIGPATAQVGASGTVAVFLRSKTKWPVEHNDAYWDDAALVYASPQGAAPTAAQPPAATAATPPAPAATATAGPSPTPRPTPTPRPDGAIVHVVESGDTLSGIAQTYGVTVEQLRQLNAGSIGDNDLIIVDQELVVSVPGQQPGATPLPTQQPTATPMPASPTPEASPAPTASASASICVLAYHDRNGDTVRDEATEELLPNAEFTVTGAPGVSAAYTSDGISEPYCFTGLVAGSYHVVQTPPAGYAPSGQAEYDVSVTEGANLPLQIGNVRQEGPATTTAATVAAPGGGQGTGTSSGSTSGRVFATVAKVSGVLVLILVAGMAVLYFVTRRRR